MTTLIPRLVLLLEDQICNNDDTEDSIEFLVSHGMDENIVKEIFEKERMSYKMDFHHEADWSKYGASPQEIQDINNFRHGRDLTLHPNIDLSELEKQYGKAGLEIAVKKLKEFYALNNIWPQ